MNKFDGGVSALLEQLNEVTGALQTTLRQPDSGHEYLVLVDKIGHVELAIGHMRIVDDNVTTFAYRSGNAVIVNDYPSYKHAPPDSIQMGLR